MKKIAVITTLAMMSLTSFLKASNAETQSNSMIQAKKNCQPHYPYHCYDNCPLPFGSFYVNNYVNPLLQSTAVNPPQQIFLTNPISAVAIYFYHKNSTCGVTLSDSKNSIVIPKKDIIKLNGTPQFL